MAKVDQVVNFINELTHTKGKWAGKKFALRGWQETFVRKLFGTLKPDGRRQYRTALLFIARKNGKTELAAALALWMLLGDGEKGARIYSAASTRDQAALIFSVAAQMVRNDDTLRNCCHVIDSQKKIIYKANDSFYQAVSSEAGTKHGIDASCIILDEVHTFGANRELFDVLRTSVGARDQPLEILLTTAGCDRDGLEYELFDYAVKIRDGILDDPSFLGELYYADDEDDWTLEATWRKANPALGDFRSLDEMQRMCDEAQKLVSRQNAFRRLYLNQHTEQDERWLDVMTWDQGYCEDWPDLSGVWGYAGCDLASTMDTTALVVVWLVDGLYYIKTWFWVPAEADERRDRQNKAKFGQWAKEGYISRVPGNALDHNDLVQDIVKICSENDVREIAVDRNFGGTQCAINMERQGLKPILFPMTIQALSPGCKMLEGLLADSKLRHDGNKVMRWQVSNVVRWEDNNENIRPDKKKSADKIDGVMSLAMALARMQMQNVGPSIYDKREMLVI